MKGSVHGEGMYMVRGVYKVGGRGVKKMRGSIQIHGEGRRYVVCVG